MSGVVVVHPKVKASALVGAILTAVVAVLQSENVASLNPGLAALGVTVLGAVAGYLMPAGPAAVAAPVVASISQDSEVQA